MPPCVRSFILRGSSMMQTMLKAKLHQATVTHTELDYDGSCAIDTELLEASGIREFEQIQIYNITNGERFTTYAILAERGSKIISLNGAAAHKADPGDRVIICAYSVVDEEALENYKPTLLYLNENNDLVRSSQNIPAQAA